MADSSRSSGGPTHAQRRATYGFNVAVAIAAAVGVAVFVNLIAFKYLYKARADLTASGAYSLSPQTRKVLKGCVENYRIVTLFETPDDTRDPATPAISRARDLIEQYGYVTDKVTVDQIDPGREPGRLDKFYRTLTDRYRPQLQELDKTIKHGREALAKVQQQIDAERDPVGKLLEDPGLADGDSKKFIRSVAQVLASYNSRYADVPKAIDKALDKSLPDYGAALTSLKTLLTYMDNDVYSRAMANFKQLIASPATPEGIKNQILKINELFAQSRETIKEPLAELQNAKPVPDYDKLHDQLADQNAAVIVGPHGVRVVSLNDMFRAPAAAQAQNGATPQATQLQFLGEEKLTGALVSMELKNLPMVVFVSSGSREALGPQGEYTNVAARLTNMNFKVEEWNPTGGKMNPMTGQPEPPGPPPQPESGQKAVWIILASEPANPMMPTAGGGDQAIIDLLSRRLAVGDAALVMLGYNQGARMGMATPLADWFKKYDLTPMVDRIILQQVQTSERTTTARPNITVDRWPDALGVSQALAGKQGVFVDVCPLVLGQPKNKDEHIYPLVNITGRGLWAERELSGREMPKLKPETAADSFTIAAAVEKGKDRIIVITDGMWASDRLTNYGALGENTAAQFGEAFPANGELFVNSVLWLSDLDQLIAASARSQDIRRIGDINEIRLTALKWSFFLGMPLLVALAGLGVWFVRRRG